MKPEYDFSQAKRVQDVPHLATLQNENLKGKTRITIRLDDDVLEWFRAKVEAQGGGNYQTMINRILKEHIQQEKPLKELLREVIREELKPAA
jgi:uncharacterized protein (DUF4415 family)